MANDNKDFTDYWLLFERSNRLEEFDSAWNELVKNAKTLTFEDDGESEGGEEYEEVDFFDAIEEDCIGKNIRFKALVIGEALKPYRFPTKVKLTCEFTRGDKCKSCALFVAGGEMEISLSKMNPLELIECTNYQQQSLIKNQVGIGSCAQFKIEALEEKNLQELYLAPVIDEEKMEQRFINRHAYCLSTDIVPNRIYNFSGKTVTQPTNQSIVFYFKEYQEEQSALDTFKLSKEEIEELKIFQITEEHQTIAMKIKEIYDDFSVNLSPIIKSRDDILFAVDLVYHSVLNFWFLGSHQRGWAECLIIGDTSTGKSKTAKKLLNHYKMGAFQSAKTATVAGLIGGMTKMESSNIMTWGLLPLNNSKLVILDEMSGIDKQIIGDLTSIRDDGIASRIIVGGPRSTSSKVRLIWTSNPRKRAMNLYDSGCDIVMELVGQPEDVSRFDFILTVSSDEVSAEEMNKPVGTKPPHRYTSDLCHKLVLWTWSRTAEQVVFDKGLDKLILNYSIEMSKKYSPAFPLVLGSTIRLKLAKLSVALAARLFSTDDGENIRVKEEHVWYIRRWLESIYRKPSFGYEDFSAFDQSTDTKTQEAKEGILGDIKLYCDNEDAFMRNMMNTKKITALEIQDFARSTKARADILRSKLVSINYLERKSGVYIKTAEFRNFLKKELKR